MTLDYPPWTWSLQRWGCLLLLLFITSWRGSRRRIFTVKMWEIYHKMETKVQLICCLICSAADTEPSYFIGNRFASWSREYSLLTIRKLQNFFECGRKMVQPWIYLNLWGFFWLLFKINWCSRYGISLFRQTCIIRSLLQICSKINSCRRGMDRIRISVKS